MRVRQQDTGFDEHGLTREQPPWRVSPQKRTAAGCAAVDMEVKGDE